jgi:hypothetical protein
METEKTWVYFIVTGQDRSGRRFKLTYPYNRAGQMTALGINLWRGSKWREDANGKRELLARIWN